MAPGRAGMRQIHESNLEKLLQDYKVINEQILETIDRDDRNRLKRKANSIEKEIHELDDKLRSFDIELDAPTDHIGTPYPRVPLTIEWLSQEQYHFLEVLFQSFSETLVEQLTSWCHDAVP